MANTIPDDVIYSRILPKLPVKSLTRFKCVSKSWLTLISSAYFIRLHHRHALLSDNANRLVIFGFDSNTHFVAYDLDSSLDEPLFYPYPKPVFSGVKANVVVASCDFFVLLRVWSSWEKPYELFVVNPSTHTYREIPCPKAAKQFQCLRFEICLNETTDDYNVIMIEHFVNDLKEVVTEIMKYCSVTNSWRLIGHRLKPSNEDFNWDSNNAIVSNNLLYMNLSSNGCGKKDIRIDYFDIQAQQWSSRIPLPHDNIRGYHLRVLDGSLCVLGVDSKNVACQCQVWVMKDCWVNLISTPDRYYPVAYRRGSRHELLCRPYRRFCRYNLIDKAATHFSVDCSVRCGNGLSQIDHVCRESLVAFPNKLQKVVPKEIYFNLENNTE